jgi:hypothetical protein
MDLILGPSKTNGERFLCTERSDLSGKKFCILVVVGKRWAGHVACMGDRRGAYRILVGRQNGKIALGKPRCRWKDNIKMDLQEVGWGGMNWIDLARDRDRWRELVNAVMNLRVP